MSDFCLTGVSLALLGRPLSIVLAVLLTDVRVCREASEFIALKDQQNMPIHHIDQQQLFPLFQTVSTAQIIAHKLAVCRKVKASNVDVMTYHFFCVDLRVPRAWRTDLTCDQTV